MDSGRGPSGRAASAVVVLVLSALALLPTSAVSAGSDPPGPAAPPAIIFEDPLDGAVDVPVYVNITVGFTDPMNTTSATITTTPAFSFSAVWYAGDTYVNYSHATPFPACTSFLVMINGTDKLGNPLVPGPLPNPWPFTTACGNPFVVSTAPPDGATNIALDASIVAVFSESMNTTSVTWSFAPALPFNETWDISKTTVTLSHTAPFSACTVYTVQILSGTDTAGYPLVPLP